MTSNADIDAMSADDFYKEFRSIWRGKEIKLTNEVSAFSSGRGRCTMMVISGQHGTERSGPISLLNWAKWLSSRKINGKIIVVPIINCLAWNRRERAPRRLNANRIWHESKCHRAPQVKQVMKMLKKHMPLIWLDLHEDSTIKDNLHYIFRNKDCEWGKELQRAAEVSVHKGVTSKHDGQTSESYAHQLGVNKSFTTESCPYLHLDERVEFQQKVIDYCFRWANNKDNWKESVEDAL